MPDIKRAYICADETYNGKPFDGNRDKYQGKNFVLFLVNSIEGTDRNITVKHFFKDYFLAK